MSVFDSKGRLPGMPVAIVDIGSNSVRLVAYEALRRSPTPTFNEKVLCGLGKGVATSGFLTDESVAKALAALRRFRVLCRVMMIVDLTVVATAAVRDAANGSHFLGLAEQAIGCRIDLLDGAREALLSALGVLSSIHAPDGVVGDLGGGSLELIEVGQGRTGSGVTLPVGGLSLMDVSERSPKKAARIVREALAGAKPLDQLDGRTFYAVGGTWRALARLHMRQRQYPLNVMHNYVIPSRDALEFAKLVERIEADALMSIESVSAARRPLLAYGAVVLEEIIRRAGPKEIVMSALGVREGLLFERLPQTERDRDPLLVAAEEFNVLRSRAPAHGEELFAWTGILMQSSHLEETAEDERLRHAACLLSDVGWRAHPDYRGEQSLNLIANAAVIGIDHPGRAYLALAASYRHISGDQEVGPHLRALVPPRMLDRARILGAAMRVAYIISAAMPGVLPRAPMTCQRGKVVLELPADLAPLNSDRLQNRMKQFARLIGGDPEIRPAPASAGRPPQTSLAEAE
ncbi:MAG: exopolyphosphatase [Roseiarcus sp.]|jgi:exopolyphosphatase/guanosine-5'-triphosphate,3'-diphosphate pyrophosphatase